MKVYCSECKWYKWHHSTGGTCGPSQPAWPECRYSFNLKKVDSYRKQIIERAWTPDVKNKNNDCEHYEKKTKKKKWWESQRYKDFKRARARAGVSIW